LGFARNIKLFALYQILSLEGVCHGLYVVWLVHHKGLPPEQVALLMAVGDLLLMAVHVPTGMLADRFGRRWSLVVGSAIQAAGLATMWLGTSPAMIAASSLAIGLGDAFRGGADEALLYESLKAQGREGDFERLLARSSFWSQSVLVVLVLGGGALVARFGFDAAWAAEVALSVAGLGIALLMRETPNTGGEREYAPSPDFRAGRAFRLSRFLPVLMPAAIAGALAGYTGFGVEASWHGDAHSAVQLTWVVAAVMAAEALGAFLASRLTFPGRDGGQAVLISGGLALAAATTFGTAATAGFAVAGVPAIAILAAAVLNLLAGWAQPVRAARIQVIAHDGQRATLASVAGTLDMGVQTGGLALYGFLLTGIGLGAANAALAFLLGGAWLAATIASRVLGDKSLCLP
jgi:hypothetical protein